MPRRVAKGDEARKGTGKSRRSVKCKWVVGSKSDMTCTECYSNSEELFQHVSQQHVSRGPKGFMCKWSQCGSRNNVVYSNQEAFQKHLRTHIFVDHPDGANQSSDEDVESSPEADDDTDYDFSADRNSRRAAKAAKKRKNNAAETNRAKVHKTSDSSSVSRNTTSDKPSTAIKLADTSSFFYRFICEWYASAAQYGVDSSLSKSIKCKRRFNKLNEAVEHLQSHHIEKLRTHGEPLKCAWQDCDSGEFSDEEDIKRHVVYHAKGDKAPPAGTEQVKIHIDTGLSTGKTVKKDSGLTWYTVTLHSLLTCNVSFPKSEMCNTTCFFCRFSALKSSIDALGSSSSSILSEFRDLLMKFEACKDNPFRFVSCFIALATDHEETYHGSGLLKDMFWIEDMKDSDLKCQKHTDNSLINFFPTLYKNCSVCSQNSKRWPTAEKRNLVLGLDNSVQTKVSRIVFVKGREYSLRAVLCLDSKTGLYYAHSLQDDEWTTFRESSVKPTEIGKVVKDKGARLVIYSNDEEINIPAPTPVTIPESCPIPDIDPCPMSVSPGPNVIQPERSNMVFSSTFSARNFKQLPDDSYHICRRKGGDFDSVLASRKLSNKEGIGSCVNVVLQALLTTGLSVISERLCDIHSHCHFCQVLSVSQRVLSNKEGKTTDPFELYLNRTRLGIPKDAEGSPVDYLKQLIEKVVADEQNKHQSSNAKYKLMVRFQKKCPCTESFEAHHWTVNPSKKHDSLFELMAQHSLYCDKCGNVALTEAVQLPEALIITVESDVRDYTLHYPEEMPTRTGRYFLAAVVVSNDDRTHFSAYCRVFGKWLLYDDDKECREVTGGDVLYLQTNIRVLIYVTKELSCDDIRLSLAKSKEKRELKMPVVVKEERDP